jgi:type IV secretory pathway TrbD component
MTTPQMTTLLGVVI